MKTLLICFAVLIFSGCYVNKFGHQGGYKPLKAFKNDTTAYVKYNFFDHKERYLHKPLSVFLNDWELPLKSFVCKFNADKKFTHLGISQYDEKEIHRHLGDKVSGGTRLVYFTWQEPLNLESTVEIMKKTHLAWRTDAIVYFQNRTISDYTLPN